MAQFVTWALEFPRVLGLPLFNCVYVRLQPALCLALPKSTVLYYSYGLYQKVVYSTVVMFCPRRMFLCRYVPLQKDFTFFCSYDPSRKDLYSSVAVFFQRRISVPLQLFSTQEDLCSSLAVNHNWSISVSLHVCSIADGSMFLRSCVSSQKNECSFVAVFHDRMNSVLCYYAP